MSRGFLFIVGCWLGCQFYGMYMELPRSDLSWMIFLLFVWEGGIILDRMITEPDDPKTKCK